MCVKYVHCTYIKNLEIIVAESYVALAPISIVMDGFHHVVFYVKCHLQDGDLKQIG
jgi:hypothetical protein